MADSPDTDAVAARRAAMIEASRAHDHREPTRLDLAVIAQVEAELGPHARLLLDQAAARGAGSVMFTHPRLTEGLRRVGHLRENGITLYDWAQWVVNFRLITRRPYPPSGRCAEIAGRFQAVAARSRTPFRTAFRGECFFDDQEFPFRVGDTYVSPGLQSVARLFSTGQMYARMKAWLGHSDRPVVVQMEDPRGVRGVRVPKQFDEMVHPAGVAYRVAAVTPDFKPGLTLVRLEAAS